jgi:glyoxylase-like metal-dependent hydrolase (beta-lactamase superfamily II)
VIFRQLFDCQPCTYTYLLAARRGDGDHRPGAQKAEELAQLIDQLQLRLAVAIGTHTQADHITALGTLRERSGCLTMTGERTRAQCASATLRDGEPLRFDGVELRAMDTAGHTDESFSLVMDDRVFTGDALLILGRAAPTSRTAIRARPGTPCSTELLRQPGETRVDPGHDDRGWTVSTIAEERASNPRLQVASAEEDAELMGALQLPAPRLMDVAVPANLCCVDVKAGVCSA